MQVKTIWNEKLNRNLIVCSSCGQGIKGTAYSSMEKGKGFECEKCEFKER